GFGTVRPSRYRRSSPVSKQVTTPDSLTGLATWVARSRPPTPHEDRQPMPATAPSDQAPGVERPKYPLHAMTTFELRDYRRELERTIALYDKNYPAAPVRANLQAALDGVIAAQDDRKKLADA